MESTRHPSWPASHLVLWPTILNRLPVRSRNIDFHDFAGGQDRALNHIRSSFVADLSSRKGWREDRSV